MRPLPSWLVAAALLPLAAGCADWAARVEATADDLARTLDPARPRPGLEKVAAPSALPPPSAEPPPPAPVPPPPSALPFPADGLPAAEAERLLAGDPMALRFLALRMLAERGLVPADDATSRKADNIGALLPLTAPQPPATGLDRPIPPLDAIATRFAALARDRGTPATQAAERTFLLDALLPRQPAARQALAPADQASARQARARLDRLRGAGLITAEEHAAEAAALEALMPTLPESPPPPAPAVKKTRPGAASGRGARMPGGVSGRLEVVPSPPGVAAPPLAAGHVGPVGVHLLSMGSGEHGAKAWEALKAEFPALASLSFKVVRAELGELGVTHRLIAGPLEAAGAERLCGELRAKGQTCQPTPFPP